MHYVLLILLILVSPLTLAQRAPNVVIILMDDMGHRDLGCTGSPFYETPNIDALAHAGLRFTHAYAAAPVCSPTRAALMTGLHPARLHLTDWLPGRRDLPSQKLLRPAINQSLPHDTDTLPKLLKKAGYRTAHVGKWHLGDEQSSPERHGFDVNRGGTRAGSPPGGYFTFKTPTLATEKDEYLTDRLATESIRFIEQSKEHPFFLHLAHYAVHIPLQAKPEVVERYRAKAKPGAVHDNPVYAAMIHSVDEGVGRIVGRLKDLDLLDNTLIIFTSDNGGLSTKEGPHTPATSNAPLRAGKGHLYDGGIRVPLIVHHPARHKPAVIDAPTTTMDLYATILRAAGADVRRTDGAPLFPAAPEHRPLFWHYPHYSNQGGRPSSAIRLGDWKLIEFHEDDRLELYNLNDDPSETTNLAEVQRDKATDLHRKLTDWRRSMNAQMPTPNPDYQSPRPRPQP